MRTIAVTGGTGDLGSVVVPRLAREYRCAVVYRTSEAWDRLRSEAGRSELIGLDSVQAFGRVAPLHALVHLAGGYASGSSPEEFQRMLEMNLMSAVYAIDGALPHISNGGRIVAISSAASLSKPAGLAAYNASKAALNAVIETLAKDLEGRDITVNALLPTTLDTPLMRKQLSPDKLVKRENVAEMISLLLSPQASNVNGQLIAMSA